MAVERFEKKAGSSAQGLAVRVRPSAELERDVHAGAGGRRTAPHRACAAFFRAAVLESKCRYQGDA